jgi:hypothetical protein
MKKTLITLIGILGLVAASSAVAVAAGGAATSGKTTAGSTATDVKTLASAESNVVTLLRNYKATTSWKSQFKTAIAKQTNDVAKVNADLSPTVKGAVLFSGSGSNIKSTRQFTVPTSAGGWHVNWSYNCPSSFGIPGTFTFLVYRTGLDFNDAGPEQLGYYNGHGTEHYHDTGTFHLFLDTECNWTVQVVAGS